jgi:hypothetical protein
MTISLNTIMENLPPEQRAIVEKRSVELMAEEMTLQDLRKARKFTQIRMAELLNMRQENVSRLERRAEFKDRPPVKITGLTSMFEESSYTNGEEEF